MAANSSVPADDEKLVQGQHKQTNGQASANAATPRPQRVLRLNRRGLYFSCRDKQNLVEETTKVSQPHKSITPQQESGIKSPPQTEKKKIKLSNSRDSDMGSNHNLKRYSSDTSTSDTDMIQDTIPPKKKHKLITWP